MSTFPPYEEPPGFRADRLHRVAEHLAASASGTEPAELPAALCRACVDLLDVTGASASLAGEAEAQVLWWSSDPVAERLAEIQYSLGEGPCRNALTLAAPVLAADLADGPDARRWPVFARQAVALGVRAVFSLPLGSSRLAIGTLDLHRDEPGPLAERDRSFTFLAADAITTALLSLHAESEGAAWLGTAENDHGEVHQATGMLMVRLGVDSEHALAALRAHAFAEGRTLTETARDVIAGKAGGYGGGGFGGGPGSFGGGGTRGRRGNRPPAP
ncbi:GAF domain-containing protein [Streptomyces sp. CC208A]|uniref:GAF domain-containing protein n=1 Tax=Streptomyces sp. CC208A TaxID=3044573 RepID=UPI0024A93065|nr:GAF domain-containing protein [Streptomyces sp. CC208A]